VAKYRRDRDVISEATEGGVVEGATLMNLLSPMGKTKSAPRVSTKYTPVQEDEYGDYINSYGYRDEIGGSRDPSSLPPRARAAYEMSVEINKLLQKLREGEADGEIKL